jgi:hypothetical protein
MQEVSNNNQRAIPIYNGIAFLFIEIYRVFTILIFNLTHLLSMKKVIHSPAEMHQL